MIFQYLEYKSQYPTFISDFVFSPYCRLCKALTTSYFQKKQLLAFLIVPRVFLVYILQSL